MSAYTFGYVAGLAAGFFIGRYIYPRQRVVYPLHNPHQRKSFERCSNVSEQRDEHKVLFACGTRS
jgi:hypothetical protein